jgi:hypothetical protein
LTEVTKQEPCQVRRKTESPCLGSAEVEILGVAFCGPCARQQEVYFAIGELTQEEEAWGLCGRALAEALKRVRRECAGSTEGIAPEVHRGLSGECEGEPLSLTSS